MYDKLDILKEVLKVLAAIGVGLLVFYLLSLWIPLVFRELSVGLE